MTLLQIENAQNFFIDIGRSENCHVTFKNCSPEENKHIDLWIHLLHQLCNQNITMPPNLHKQFTFYYLAFALLNYYWADEPHEKDYPINKAIAKLLTSVCIEDLKRFYQHLKDPQKNIPDTAKETETSILDNIRTALTELTQLATSTTDNTPLSKLININNENLSHHFSLPLILFLNQYEQSMLQAPNPHCRAALQEQYFYLSTKNHPSVSTVSFSPRTQRISLKTVQHCREFSWHVNDIPYPLAFPATANILRLSARFVFSLHNVGYAEPTLTVGKKFKATGDLAPAFIPMVEAKPEMAVTHFIRSLLKRADCILSNSDKQPVSPQVKQTLLQSLPTSPSLFNSLVSFLSTKKTVSSPEKKTTTPFPTNSML